MTRTRTGAAAWPWSRSTTADESRSSTPRFPISTMREAGRGDELERLAAIVADSGDAIIGGTLDGVIDSWNAAAERLIGYPASEVIGRSIDLLVPAETCAERGAILERVRRGSVLRGLETCFRRADGSLVEVALTLSPTRSADGRPAGASIIARDLTDAKRLGSQLRDAQERFANAFRTAPSGMALVAPDGRFLEVNRALCAFLGRPADELLGSNFQGVTHPLDLDADLARVGRLLSGEIAGYDLQKRYVRADGGTVWGQLDVSLVRDEAGDPAYFVCRVQDIDDRVRGETQLRRYTDELIEQAARDALTGLLTYRDLRSTLERELVHHGARDRPLTVLALDLARFGRLNRDLGASYADLILQQVAAAVIDAGASREFAARIAGDRFATILTNAGADAGAVAAAKVQASLAAIHPGLGAVVATASFPADGCSGEALLATLEDTMQRLKGETRGRQSALEPPAGGGRADSPPLAGGDAGLARVLELARAQVGLPIAILALVTSGGRPRHVVVGDTTGLDPGGEALEAIAAACAALAGREPLLIPDAAADLRTRRLATRRDCSVGALAAAPVRLGDGRVVGTVSFLGPRAEPGLVSLDPRVLELAATFAAEQLERPRIEASDRRSQIQVAGIRSLLAALDARDRYTGEHSAAVVALATGVARRLGLPEEEILEVEQVAVLHDIGKVGIPDSVLQKQGLLSDDEWELMRQHPIIGARVVASSPDLAHLASAVRAEHERWDGGGYPDGLRGSQIPIASRITLACDAYHAMTSDRPYRPAMCAADAVRELERNAGEQFDPAVVGALLAVLGPSDEQRLDPRRTALVRSLTMQAGA